MAFKEKPKHANKKSVCTSNEFLIIAIKVTYLLRMHGGFPFIFLFPFLSFVSLVVVDVFFLLQLYSSVPVVWFLFALFSVSLSLSLYVCLCVFCYLIRVECVLHAYFCCFFFVRSFLLIISTHTLSTYRNTCVCMFDCQTLYTYHLWRPHQVAYGKKRLHNENNAHTTSFSLCTIFSLTGNTQIWTRNRKKNCNYM